MHIDIDGITKKAAGQIEVEIHNDSDKLIKFHAVTAGNINGIAFNQNKVEFDGFINPRQSTLLLSKRVPGIPIKRGNINSDNPDLRGIYEYELVYYAAENENCKRKSVRGLDISYWLPAIKMRSGTKKMDSITVKIYNEVEE